MKRIITLSLAAMMLVSALVGCATTPPKESAPVAKTPEELTTAYKTAIDAARSEEDKTYHPMVTGADDQMSDLSFQTLGVAAEDMTAYAIAVSAMNIQAYGVAAIMPAEGKSDGVLKAINAFVANQKASFEQYLPDQKEIANAAKVETLADGTILLVMSAEQDTIFDAVKKALNA